MVTKIKGFWTQLIESLAPPENRLLAAVAFVRTFRQGFKGSSIVAAGGGVTLTAAGLAEVNWVTVTYALIAVGLSGLAAGSDAYFDVLANGINSKYADAVQKQIDSA